LRSLRIGLDARELQGRATGVGRYLRRLLEAWPEASGDRVSAYFNGPPPRELPDSRASLELRGLGPRALRGLVWQELWLPAAARADRLDVFFAPAYACPLRLTLPRVTTVHDLSFFALPEDFTPLDAARRRALVRSSVRASRQIVAVSDFTRRELAAFLPESDGRVVTIGHGADTDVALPPRERAREALGVRGPLLLTVGSILNRRHLPELLRAVGRLARRHPGVTLDVVGENRTHPPLDLPRLVAELGLVRHVRLSGFLRDDELLLRYAAADLAVYLSAYEGFGIPVLEAMAHGLPVVTSERPATGEIFAGAARLVDPRDAGAIASTLDALLLDPAARADFAARGKALAAAHSWREAASRTRAVLEDAAS
jgi:glycosyltransferase involved in cell wall biosynthesis